MTTLYEVRRLTRAVRRYEGPFLDSINNAIAGGLIVSLDVTNVTCLGNLAPTPLLTTRVTVAPETITDLEEDPSAEK